MEIILYIIGWVVSGVLAYRIMTNLKFDDVITVFSSVLLAPIAFLGAIVYWLTTLDYSKLLWKKSPPPVGEYKWGDIIEVEGNGKGIWVGTNAGYHQVILQGYYQSITVISNNSISPIISGELEDELRFAKASEDYKQSVKYMEEKAKEVQKYGKKIKNIFTNSL